MPMSFICSTAASPVKAPVPLKLQFCGQTWAPLVNLPFTRATWIIDGHTYTSHLEVSHLLTCGTEGARVKVGLGAAEAQEGLGVARRARGGTCAWNGGNVHVHAAHAAQDRRGGLPRGGLPRGLSDTISGPDAWAEREPRVGESREAIGVWMRTLSIRPASFAASAGLHFQLPPTIGLRGIVSGKVVEESSHLESGSKGEVSRLEVSAQRT